MAEGKGGGKRHGGSRPSYPANKPAKTGKTSSERNNQTKGKTRMKAEPKAMYECEIISNDTGATFSGRVSPSYALLARITSVNHRPQDFETAIGFTISACKGYDSNTSSYPSIITAPLEMIHITDRIEFDGTPYNKKGRPTSPQNLKETFWIAVDPTSHIKRLPPDLKYARKLVTHLKKKKGEERKEKRRDLKWRLRCWWNNIISWIKSELPGIIKTITAGLLLYFLIKILTKAWALYQGK